MILTEKRREMEPVSKSPKELIAAIKTIKNLEGLADNIKLAANQVIEMLRIAEEKNVSLGTPEIQAAFRQFEYPSQVSLQLLKIAGDVGALFNLLREHGVDVSAEAPAYRLVKRTGVRVKNLTKPIRLPVSNRRVA